MILRSGKVTLMSPQPLGDSDVLGEDRWPYVSPCCQLQKTTEASRLLERSWTYEDNTQAARNKIQLSRPGQCQALSLAQESLSRKKWAKAFEEEPQVSCSRPTTPTSYFSALPLDETFSYPLSNLTPCPLYRRRLWPRRLKLPPKTRSMPDSTLVLELDGILVSCSLRAQSGAHFSFPVRFQGMYYKVQSWLRPHALEFLEILSQSFQIIIFTTAKRDFAEPMADLLDPHKKWIRGRLFQEDCICLWGHYVRDLRVLGQDLARTVVLTDSPEAFPYQIDNQLLIPPWQGHTEDQELSKLLPLLEHLSHLDDVRPELRNLRSTLSPEEKSRPPLPEKPDVPLKTPQPPTPSTSMLRR